MSSTLTWETPGSIMDFRLRYDVCGLDKLRKHRPYSEHNELTLKILR